MRIARVERRFTPTADGRAAEAAGGMVASAFPEATQAGVELLAQGGNAIDAACAVGLALGVCEPQASGLGGQTLGLVHFDGRVFAVDGSSRAPSRAVLDATPVDDRRTGHRATTVPSTPATYAWLNRRYGRVSWSDVLQPAIRIAREGYAITELQSRLQARARDAFLAAPGGAGARYFLRAGGAPYEPGERFTQPDLASALQYLSLHGVEAFYTGDIGARIHDDMVAHDGLLRADDLALIPWPVERPALRRRYRGYLIASMPPPGAGQTLLLVMMMLQRLQSRFLTAEALPRFHFMAETFRKAFLQRLDRPYDPNTYHQMPTKTMLSRSFARRLANSIADEMDATLPLEDYPGEQLADTTHFSVMDAEGNVVAMTQSIELVYGAKAACDGIGFLYNNYLMAFETEDPRHPYYLRPNAVPWSSAAPSIVYRRRQPLVAAGSPGSERIFSSVAQFLVHLIDGSRDIGDAVAAPRFHTSTGGQVSLEAGRYPPELADYLAGLGYQVDEREPFYLGCVQAVLRRQTGPGFQGAADPRRDGAAAGPP